jgi:hypothetical protein
VSTPSSFQDFVGQVFSWLPAVVRLLGLPACLAAFLGVALQFFCALQVVVVFYYFFELPCFFPWLFDRILSVACSVA